MNSLIKTYSFWRTSHGGGVSGTSKKSRIVPIARWLQRRMVLFLCRIEEPAIRKHKEDHPMPYAFQTQALSQDDAYELSKRVTNFVLSGIRKTYHSINNNLVLVIAASY